jgi:hypothetical protein
LSKARDALTGLRIALLPLWAIVDTLIVATRLAGAAVNRPADAARACFTRLALRLAIAAMVLVDLGIDALVVAHRPVVATLTLTVDTRISGRADVAAGAAILRIILEAHALMIAARTGQATACIRGALSFRMSRLLDAREHTARTLLMEISMRTR